jgi:ACS family hexuronate transporter-like MFS transporter
MLWTAAGASTALVTSTLGLAIARSFLALGEAGNFPAAIKTVAEWFPQRDRAHATGIFNSGSNIGAILAPLLVPFVIFHFGSWQAAFLITPTFAVVWIGLWLYIYRSPHQHPRCNSAERDYINCDGVQAPRAKVKWRQILPHRQTWAIMVGKFLTDPIWWFYLFWSGKFIADKFHVQMKGLALPLIVIYVLASFGSLAGGWLSSTLIRSGWTPNAARKTAMFACALAVAPVSVAPIMPSMWPAVFLIAIAAAAHQGFSANIFTLTSDMFEKAAVGSVVGLAGLCGGLGSILLQFSAGKIVQASGSYLKVFIIAAAVYMLAVVMIQVLAPKLTPVDLNASGD